MRLFFWFMLPIDFLSFAYSFTYYLIALRASEAAAQCIVIGHVCLYVGGRVGVFVGLLP